MATATLTLVTMADPDTGGWCPRCSLPSVVSQTFEVIVGKSTEPGRLWTVHACLNCDTTLEGHDG